jgi:hypothetical protein
MPIRMTGFLINLNIDYKYGLFYIDYREYLLSNFPPHSDICTDSDHSWQ